MSETANRYRLYCEICGYNRWTDGADLGDLVPYQRSKIQTEIPKIDPKTKKAVTKFINQPKQFKCPNCGRIITPRRWNAAAATEEQTNRNSRGQDSLTQPGISQEIT